MNTGQTKLNEVVATVFATTIPAIQFIYALFGTGNQGLFLFQGQFVLVSAVTGALSYAAILVIKDNHFFSWAPFQSKRKAKWEEWDLRTNARKALFDDQAVQAYAQKHSQPKQIFYFNAENINQRLLFPVIGLTFLIFFGIGMAKIQGLIRLDNSWGALALILLQIMSYLLLLLLIVSMFAIFYFKSKNRAEYAEKQKNLYTDALKLARENNAFNEEKHTVFIQARDFINGFDVTHGFFIKVGDNYYVFLTDNSIEKILIVRRFDTFEEADRFISGVY